MYLVLIGGGHAAGKRTVAQDLSSSLKKEIHGSCEVEITTINLADYSVLHGSPHEVDYTKVQTDISKLSEKGPKETKHVCLLFGNYALYNDKLCDEARLKIFLDTDADVRLSRWIMRDAVQTKKLGLSDVLQNYLNICRTEYTEYIDGTKVKADILLPQGSDPLTTDVIVSGIVSELVNSTSGTTTQRRIPVVNLRDEDDGMFYSTD